MLFNLSISNEIELVLIRQITTNMHMLISINIDSTPKSESILSILLMFSSLYSIFNSTNFIVFLLINFESYSIIWKNFIEDKMEKYFIYTYGCQMNVHESEKLAGMLETKGLKKAEKVDEADVIVFNTCCIRESAEQKIMGNIGAIKPLKKKNKDIIVAVCGCMSQQKDKPMLLRKKFPFINIIFGANNIEFFSDYLDEYNKEKKYLNKVIEGNYQEKEDGISFVRDNKLYAYVNIMYGCNNFCTYCIVPFVRGREVSRHPDTIYREVKDLISRGYKVITLLGQNVNSYGLDNNTGGVLFPKLLETIANFEGDFEVRFMTSHPKDISDDLIEVMARNDKISKTLHLPAQSGSNTILKSMNRNYTVESYLEKIEKIKAKMPNITLSTDIIVGFPGEGEEEYQLTKKLSSTVRYHNAFIFMYSPRRGTVAEKMENQVSIEEKHRRVNDLLKLEHEISDELFHNMVGSNQRVLVEGEVNEFLIAKAQCGKVVKIEKNESIHIGEFVYVKIVDYKSGDLIGKI